MTDEYYGKVGMKIAIFSAQYLPTFGGVERYTEQIARHAVQAGHEVSVVTSALAGLRDVESTPEGISIIRLPVYPMMKGRFPFLRPSLALRKLRHSIWSKKPDIVLIQTRLYPLSIYAARQAKKYGIPSVLIDHSSGHMKPNGLIRTLLGHAYEHVTASILKNNCNHIYGVSLQTVEWLKHFKIVSEGVLSNAVDLRQIDGILSSRTDNSWHDRLGLAKGTSILLFSGRLIPEKGILQLMDAMPLLNKHSAHLLIAGDGPLMDEIQKRRSNQVHVLGRLSYEDMIGLFGEADLFCLPTTYAEGFPTTFLEAAACRCPIVTTQTSGVDALILSGRYGRILKDQSPGEIAKALNEALDCPDWRQEAGELLRARVESCFDWDMQAKITLQVLQNIVADAR